MTVLGSLLRNRCFGVAVGLVADRLIGDPPDAAHPVAWFGSAMTSIERQVWSDRRANGVVYAAIGVGLGAGAGALVRSVPIVVAVVVGGRQLRSTAGHIGRIAATGDLDQARAALPTLVGRDPSQLDTSGIAAAAIESVAENTVDAVIAPAFWALVGGAAGAGAYRAINTMDAMVGRRNDRYERFGWAAARIDDAANYMPARIFAFCVAVQNPATAASLIRIVRRDAPAHPSPNAGVAESVVAAKLGRQLGGPLRYGDTVERRPTLGDGPRPSPTDVPQAIRIVDRVEWGVVASLACIGVVSTLVRD